jgi:hypothetical protein
VRVKIDKGIPMERHGGRSSGKFPWRQMDVGDSFLVPTEADAQRAQRAAMGFGLYHGTGFRAAYRRVLGGARVWRVA